MRTPGVEKASFHPTIEILASFIGRDISTKVYRTDGKLLGKTQNLSEGGLQLDSSVPLQAGQSILVDIEISQSEQIRARCLILDVEEVNMKMKARAQFQNLRGNAYRRLMSFLIDF